MQVRVLCVTYLHNMRYDLRLTNDKFRRFRIYKKISLIHHCANNINYYDIKINNSKNINLLEKFYLIIEQKWHKDTVAPLLSFAKGIATRISFNMNISEMNFQGPNEYEYQAEDTTTLWDTLREHIWIWLLFPFCIIICLICCLKSRKHKMSRKSAIRRKASNEGKSVDRFHFAEPSVSMPFPQTSDLCQEATPEHGLEMMELKVMGLMERRGLNSQLTIELEPRPENPPDVVTPTREYTDMEVLLNSRNVLSRSQLERAVNNPAMLHTEFVNVPLNIPDNVGISGSKLKNRYNYILPNPQSRVVLPSMFNDPLTTYINANYIRGYDGEPDRYIATQGPLPNTILDFWRMIWFKKVSIIVMITNLKEQNDDKCANYFPLDVNNIKRVQSFNITVKSIDIKPEYIIRTLEIIYDEERSIVHHFWYTSWPDHGIPECSYSLIKLAKNIDSFPKPIVVHCSAGIGRTGSFLALTIGLKQLMKEGKVDVLGILCQMRCDRGGMIQTSEQYEFVHKSLYLFQQMLTNSQLSTPSMSSTSTY